jgi:hypothetical protein
MNDAKWQKYALIGGPVFVVLAIVGTFCAGSPPSADADAQELTEFFADKTTEIKVGAWIGVLAAIFALWWFATLWRHLSAAEGGRPRLALISFGGLVFGGALNTVATMVWAGMALRVDDLGDTISPLWGFYLAAASASFVGLAIHVGAASAVGFRTKLFPQWVNGLGVLVTLATLVASLGVTTDSTGIVVFQFIGFFGWALWILVISATLWKREPAA